MARTTVVAAATEETGENAQVKSTVNGKLRNGFTKTSRSHSHESPSESEADFAATSGIGKRISVHGITARAALVGAAAYALEELENHKEHV